MLFHSGLLAKLQSAEADSREALPDVCNDPLIIV